MFAWPTKASRQRFALAAFLLAGFASAIASHSKEVTVAPASAVKSESIVPQPQLLLVQDRIATIVKELAALCPVRGVGDRKAFDSCRKALFEDSLFRRSLKLFVLWGRAPNGNIDAPLGDFRATQFGPEVFAGVYAPMWMFNGRFDLEYVPHEKKYRAFVEAGFRNELNAGDYPYPFWHDAKKWTDYEAANAIMFWIEPDTLQLSQFTFIRRADKPAVAQSKNRHMPTFDGKWMWVDEQGNRQPAPTLFVGLFSAKNPHLKTLDETYRKLALNLRDSDCMSCHVPNNPDKMKQLVLLQTPIHAASEIDRLVKSIKEDRMPVDEFGLGKAMHPQRKATMLADAEAFQAAVNAARAWELVARLNQQTTKTSALSPRLAPSLVQ